MFANKNTKIFYGNTEIKKIYLGSNLIWQRQTMDDSTLAVVNYANTNGYALPSNLTAFDNLIKGMKSCGIWVLLDRFWLFSGDGSTDFKRINIINPSKTRADFYGGLTISASGIQGNGTNAYVDTNFNPALLESGQKYQLNDASRGTIISSLFSNSTEEGSIDGVIVSSGSHNCMISSNINAQRINQNINSLSGTVDMTGLGIKIINRETSQNVSLFNKNISSLKTADSTIIYSVTQNILRRHSVGYGNGGVSCYFMGASIPFQVSQDFRTVFNTYLTAIGQTPIA